MNGYNLTLFRVEWKEGYKPEKKTDPDLLNGEFPQQICQLTTRLKPITTEALAQQLDEVKAEFEKLRDDYSKTYELIQEVGKEVKEVTINVKETTRTVSELSKIVQSHQEIVNAIDEKEIIKKWDSLTVQQRVTCILAAVVFLSIMIPLIVAIAVYIVSKYL